mgnify:CR=1 FL=1
MLSYLKESFSTNTEILGKGHPEELRKGVIPNQHLIGYITLANSTKLVLHAKVWDNIFTKY